MGPERSNPLCKPSFWRHEPISGNTNEINSLIDRRVDADKRVPGALRLGETKPPGPERGIEIGCCRFRHLKVPKSGKPDFGLAHAEIRARRSPSAAPADS